MAGVYRRAQIAVTGRFLKIQAPALLMFTWQWDGEDEISRVTVQLRATDQGTALTLLHDQHANAQSRANHVQGWQDCLDRLPSHLAEANGPHSLPVGDPGQMM